MIRLMSSVKESEGEEATLRSFDDYDVTLGDVMRGERATMGKSLMDVQRELKIKASYIAAVEDADPSVFDTPGFIAGYVRSYAKYLDLDPEWAFEKFCDESGFATSHGMSQKALPARMSREERIAATNSGRANPLETGVTAYAIPKEPFWTQIDGRALGSSLVLLTLIGGLGFGAYTVVQEIQQVEVAPFDQPVILANDLDPLAPRVVESEDLAGVNLPTPDALDRLYRPNALTTPVVTPRDGPIGQINRDSQGSYVAQVEPEISVPSAGIEAVLAEVAAVTHEGGPHIRPATGFDVGPEQITMFATQGAWVRVRAGDGSILYENIMDAGEQFVFPATETPSTIERVGNSGAVYFKVNGELFGPAGQPGQLAKNIVVSQEQLTARYSTPTGDLPQDLKLVLLQLEGQ